jgi:hypothetical protein
MVERDVTVDPRLALAAQAGKPPPLAWPERSSGGLGHASLRRSVAANVSGLARRSLSSLVRARIKLAAFARRPISAPAFAITKADPCGMQATHSPATLSGGPLALPYRCSSEAGTGH